ncbi:MAG TPA: AI-2E family transporter, partial [Methanocella sp.]|nr:AI-2E family transporter [Methanocella sp.]
MSFESLADDLYKNRLTLAAMLFTAILALAAIYYILPLADGIVFGIFFFFIVRPIKEYLDKYTKFSPYIATFCLVLPFIVLVAYGILTVWGEAQWIMGHGPELNTIADQVEATLGLPFDLSGAINGALAGSYDYAIAYLKTIPLRGAFSGLVSLVMNALISLFVCFYLLKDGGSFV